MTRDKNATFQKKYLFDINIIYTIRINKLNNKAYPSFTLVCIKYIYAV